MAATRHSEAVVKVKGDGQMDDTHSMLRVRLGLSDAHYAGELVAGARMLELFGDLATELSILHYGNEGLLRAFAEVEFLAPVHAGDFIEARGCISAVNRTSRSCEFEAYKVIAADSVPGSTAAMVLLPPVLVARAQGTIVSSPPDISGAK
jgi:3-aminobutyryl-CoA ammonia-lyase